MKTKNPESIFTAILKITMCLMKKKKCKERQRGGHKLIDGLPTALIQDSEQHFLRILQLHRHGALNLNILKNVNGIEYKNFI